MQYAVEYPKNISGIILSGTSYVGSQNESIERRKTSENKRIKESKWFAKVIEDWDYMIENNTTFDKNGNDISTARTKWWTYDEETAQKVIPIVKEITKVGRRKPIGNNYYQETPEERQKYLEFQKKFKDLKTKILIINGKYDTNNLPEFATELHFRLQNSKLVFIDKAGHFLGLNKANNLLPKLKNGFVNKETAGNIVFAKGGVEYLIGLLVAFSRACFSTSHLFINLVSWKKHSLRLVEIEPFS